MIKKRSIEEIENIEVRKEISKLLEIFEEGFLNSELELVICHPINATDHCTWDYKYLHKVSGRNVYCNVYFLTSNCKSKKDVIAKVLEWWSRDAYKSEFPCGESTSVVIQDYIREGINEYLGTDFSREDMELIYTYLGNAIHHDLCLKFIESGYDLSLLKRE